MGVIEHLAEDHLLAMNMALFFGVLVGFIMGAAVFGDKD